MNPTPEPAVVDEETDIVLTVQNPKQSLGNTMKSLNMDVIPENVYEEGITSAK